MTTVLELALAVALLLLVSFPTSAFVAVVPQRQCAIPTRLFGKKAQRKGTGGGKNKARSQQRPQEKQSVKEARFDAATRQFMFTMVGLTKVLPDKSKCWRLSSSLSLTRYSILYRYPHY